VTALSNHYFAAMVQCSKDSISIHVDGDDEFIGRNTLKLFNCAYQTKKAGVIYSDYIKFAPPGYVHIGGT